MQQFFKSFSGKPAGMRSFAAHVQNELSPAMPFVAVGDVHGRADLLDLLLAKIGLDNAEPVIFLGDYVDRGPNSAAVLTQLLELTCTHADRFICLMGNHERMMLDFLDDPLGKGLRWLRFGGLETLQSYGISAPRRPTPEAALDLSMALEAAVPARLVAWLRGLPLTWSSGNMWCAHAAMDPLKPPTRQKVETLLWGHPAFLEMPRGDGICVVHAHTTVTEPISHNSRIAIDTEAYRTGHLTAAVIDQGSCRFIQT